MCVCFVLWCVVFGINVELVDRKVLSYGFLHLYVNFTSIMENFVH